MLGLPVPTGGQQRMRYRTEQRTDDDRISALLCGLKSTLGSDPGEVSLTELSGRRSNFFGG
jgi:hypothetical protein